MSHEWAGAKALRRHGHGGDEYVEPGEKFEATDAELSAFAGSIEAVPDDESGDSDSSDSDEALTDLEGVGESTADDLTEAGYESVADVRSADADQLAEDVDGIGQSLAESLTEG